MTDPSRILVTVETNHSTMSKSGEPPFSITLKAVVEGPDVITINAFCTILLSDYPALDYQGLTFKDTESGHLASMQVIDFDYQVPEHVSSATHSIIEIPPKDAASGPYTVTHTFSVPRVRKPGPGEAPLSMEEQMELAMSQVAGFTVGHTYEIGLGMDMSTVSWWHRGDKSHVFAGDHQQRAFSPAEDKPKMEMVLSNTASFLAVD